MIDITLTTTLDNGKLLFYEESEIENLALETIGDADHLYTEEIPLNHNMIIKWDENLICWVLKIIKGE